MPSGMKDRFLLVYMVQVVKEVKQEKNDFWEELNEYLSSFKADENVVLLGDLNV